MIGRLHGKLLEKNPPQILIDVSGVGYEVDVPMSTFCNLPEVGGELTLHTHFVVREDAQLLYGFATLAERAVFLSLIHILLGRVAAHGALVLSGVLARQADEVIAVYKAADPTLVLSVWREEDGWVCLAGRRA